MAETLRGLVVALLLEKAISCAICAPQESRSRKPSTHCLAVTGVENYENGVEFWFELDEK